MFKCLGLTVDEIFAMKSTNQCFCLKIAFFKEVRLYVFVPLLKQTENCRISSSPGGKIFLSRKKNPSSGCMYYLSCVKRKNKPLLDTSIS